MEQAHYPDQPYAGYFPALPDPVEDSWGLAFASPSLLAGLARQARRNRLATSGSTTSHGEVPAQTEPATPPPDDLRSQLAALRDEIRRLVDDASSPAQPKCATPPARWLSSTAAARAAKRRLQDVLRLTDAAIEAGVARLIGRGEERRHVRWHPDHGPEWIRAQKKPVRQG